MTAQDPPAVVTTIRYSTIDPETPTRGGMLAAGIFVGLFMACLICVLAHFCPPWVPAVVAGSFAWITCTSAIILSSREDVLVRKLRLRGIEAVFERPGRS